MTEEDLIDLVFDKEGVIYGDEHTVPPIDQPTGAGGITLPVMSAYLGRTATVGDLKALTKTTARPVVRWKLRDIADKVGLAAISYEPLRIFAIDYYYNSGTYAIKWLQRVVRVKPDGVFGPETLEAVEDADPWLVLHAYIAARLQMVDMWTDSEKRRKAWEEGLENRVLSFSMLLEG